MQTIDECERAAHAEGLGAGITAALGTACAATPPGRVAALPRAQVGREADIIPHRLADRAGIALVRREGPPDQDMLLVLAARLGAARLGLTRRLVEFAADHIGGRSSGGEPTIRKQLVLGSLADLVTEVEVLRRLLRTAGDVPEAVVDVHDRTTVLDWDAAKLLGASGYLTDSPALDAYVSRLTANCWVPRPRQEVLP